MEKNTWIAGLINFLRLTHEQEDHAIVRETIEKAIVFRGTNLWILIFAILIASVGLNMNSTAVVIGAMLISPLMGPINGIGYSVATYDFNLFRKSLNNYGFATSAALVTSTLYFALTPIHTEHSELLARTSPTIYDVLIALFGGLAGVVAISSKNKGNVIPGVAIATALMPPLCTAGYGISIGSWSYFLGALYLFVINSVFIALSSMLVAQILKYPKQAYLLSSQIKNKNIAIAVVIFLTVVPSFYLGYTLVKKERFISTANEYVSEVSLFEGNYLLDNVVDGNNKKITLIYAGEELSKETIRRLKDKAKDMGMKDAVVEVSQGLRTNDQRILQAGIDQTSQLNSEIDRLKAAMVYQKSKTDSLSSIPKAGGQLLKEINAIYPQIKVCAYSKSLKYVDSLSEPKSIALVYMESSDTLDLVAERKIKSWLSRRLNEKDVFIEIEVK